MKEVTIIWEDTNSVANEWMDIDRAESLETAKAETKGFLIIGNSAKVIVAQSKSDGGDVHNLMVIPRGCIVKIKESK